MTVGENLKLGKVKYNPDEDLMSEWNPEDAGKAPPSFWAKDVLTGIKPRHQHKVQVIGEAIAVMTVRGIMFDADKISALCNRMHPSMTWNPRVAAAMLRMYHKEFGCRRFRVWRKSGKRYTIKYIPPKAIMRVNGEDDELEISANEMGAEEA